MKNGEKKSNGENKKIGLQKALVVTGKNINTLFSFIL
jgi:hypothetical protein